MPSITTQVGLAQNCSGTSGAPGQAGAERGNGYEASQAGLIFFLFFESQMVAVAK